VVTPRGKTLPEGPPLRATTTPGQLSLVEAFPRAALLTTAVHFPGSALTIRLVGAVTCGFSASRTVTICVPVAVLLAASVAVQVIVVAPRGYRRMTDGRRWLAALLARAPLAPLDVRAEALSLAGSRYAGRAGAVRPRHRRFRESTRVSGRVRRDLGDTLAVAQALEDLAALHAEQGKVDRTTHLLGAAAALCETLGVRSPVAVPETYERTVTAARAALGEAGFAASWANGRGLSLDQAVEYALGETDCGLKG